MVIPVHDEEGNIRPLAEEVRKALEGRVAFEIVYVDDASTDRTAVELRAVQGPDLRVLRHRIRSGQSAALVTGVRSARYPWVATLDGDGQNDPNDLLRLLAVTEVRGGEDLLVSGRRRQRRDGWSRRVQSRVANAVRGALLHDATPDTGCGLKLFSRALFLALPAFDHMHRFLPALVLAAGGRVESVDVEHRPRLRGRSKYGLLDRLWVGIVDMVGVRWLQRRMLRSGSLEIG